MRSKDKLVNLEVEKLRQITTDYSFIHRDFLNTACGNFLPAIASPLLGLDAWSSSESSSKKLFQVFQNPPF